MSWSTYKREYEDALDDAKVFDNSARKDILNLMRSIHTLQNMLYRGKSWNFVNNSDKYYVTLNQAYDVEKYYGDEWLAFQDALGLYPSREVNIGDFLS